MIYPLHDKLAEKFNNHFGNENNDEPTMNDSIDMEIWDKEGFMSIKNSKRIITDDKKEIVYEADIIGDIEKLVKVVEDDTGRRVTLRARVK